MREQYNLNYPSLTNLRNPSLRTESLLALGTFGVSQAESFGYGLLFHFFVPAAEIFFHSLGVELLRFSLHNGEGAFRTFAETGAKPITVNL